MKKLISAFVAISLIMMTTLTGCGGMGKVVDPVKLASPYDTDKSCDELSTELADASKTCDLKQKKVSSRNTGNVILAVIGILLFLPVLFIMDPSPTDDINYVNSVEHYNYLVSLCDKKGCETEYKMIELEKPKPVEKNGNKSSGNFNSASLDTNH